MPKINVINAEGKNIKEIEISDKIFAADIKEYTVHQVVVNHLANKRQGTQCAKTRAEVRGGGRKPWRQKGRGAARQGSIRSPQWKGGGVVFAPKPRDYSYRLPKKIKRAALFSVLTSKFNDGLIKVVEDLKFDVPSTRKMANMLDNMGAKKPLIVTDKIDRNVYLSGRNIERCEVTFADLIHTYQILKGETVIFTESAIRRLEEVFA